MKSKPIRGLPNADRDGQLQRVSSTRAIRLLRDKILLASWVFSYALILRVFRMLKSAERRSATSGGQTELTSSE